jgi:uncharacterized protein (DUF1015 family)
VIAPPYDVIGPAQQAELHSRDSRNVVRLELGQRKATDGDADNVYTRAAAQLTQWRNSRVLVQEQAPAFYLVEETFSAGGKERVRLTLYASVRLEPWERGVILPHEETTSGPKQDRLLLLKATRANISPVMGLYQDGGGLVPHLQRLMATQAPVTGPFSAAGVRYRLWVIADRATTAVITEKLSGEKIYIADGHHRYETALGFSQHEGKGLPGSGRILMGLVSMSDPGLEVQPFQRLLHGLSAEQLARLRQQVDATCAREPAPSGTTVRQRLAALIARMEGEGEGATVLGFAAGRGEELTALRLRAGSVLPPAPAPEFRECEPWVLHRGIIDPALGADAVRYLEFPHGTDEVAEALEGGAAQAAFIVRSIPLGLFRRLASKGQRLPPKSTYFYPKLPTGIVLRTLETAD